MSQQRIYGRQGVWIVAALLALGGCATPGYQKTETGATVGALGGAALGAIIGNQTGSPLAGAAIGAGVGALAGGAVGYAMDQQQQEFQQRLAAQEAANQVAVQRVQLANRQQAINLRLSGQSFFKTNSTELATNSSAALNNIAQVLNQYPNSRVLVTGYTDNTGSPGYNLQLSRDRAQTIANYLITQGVDPARIQVVGMGEAGPIASNATPAGRQLNRRVEITVIPQQNG
ncbi:MAG: OmpA family protein [Acidithiobacillus sp.]